MIEPLFRALAQLNDRVFLGVVWRSLLLSLVAFAGLLAGSVWLVQFWAAQGGWLGWFVGLLGGIAVLLMAIWFYVPVALLIATFYLDRIAGAVERRYYPGMPPPIGAPLAEQGWDGVVLAGQVLVLQVATLIASVLLPGVGLVLGYCVTGWAIGRGLFVGVAMRRMSRPDALAFYRRRWLAAVVPGIALALASSLPPLNLLVPVVGIAAMVHVFCNR
jgi:CysZ protein